jgi:hypothetical protein
MQGGLPICSRSLGTHEVGEVVEAIRDICSVEYDDGLKFDLAGIEGSRIAEDAEYEGVRVKVPTSLDGARIPIQIDVGFRDAVEPAPQLLTFPVLLPLDAPIVSAYPPEVVISEKFHAMVVLGIANSRMKDFFDVWTLASTHIFEMDALSRAVRSTFDRRRTELPHGVPLALTNEFLNDASKKTQWAALLSRVGLVGEQPNLAGIGPSLADFLMPVAAVAAGSSLSYRLWTPPGPWKMITYSVLSVGTRGGRNPSFSHPFTSMLRSDNTHRRRERSGKVYCESGKYGRRESCRCN